MLAPDPRLWCSTIWYPQGAGGMWINYLLWCNKHQTTLPDNFKSFEFGDIYEKYPEYHALLLFAKHVLIQAEGNQCKIRLGGNNWFNFYLNIVAKKNVNNYYGTAESVLLVLDNNVWPNLHWRDIIHDPKKFLGDLSSIVGSPILYNAVTQQAIKQYIDSCPFLDIDDNFCSTELYQEWARAVRDVKSIWTDDEILGFTLNNYTTP